MAGNRQTSLDRKFLKRNAGRCGWHADNSCALPSLALAAFAEFLCALAVVVGFKTRWAAIPVAITMLVAAFIFHVGDGWEKQEFPLLYASTFLALVFTGPGRHSVDAWLTKRRR